MPGSQSSKRASSTALKMNETSFRFSLINQLINVIIISLHAKCVCILSIQCRVVVVNRELQGNGGGHE